MNSRKLFKTKKILMHVTQASFILAMVKINIFKWIFKYNRWQQRNGPIIHNVISVKYNKENEIFSHQLMRFSRLKSVNTENKEHIKLHLFYCKISTLLSLLLIILSDTKTELTLVTSEYSCTESVQILRCHLLY